MIGLVAAACGSAKSNETGTVTSPRRDNAAHVCKASEVRLALDPARDVGDPVKLSVAVRSTAECRLRGHLRLEIRDTNDRLRAIDSNPSSLRLDRNISPTDEPVFASWLWDGWCDGPTESTVVARFRSVEARAKTTEVPECTPGYESILSLQPLKEFYREP